MFSLYLAVFLLHTISSKNFLVELAEEEEGNTTSPELGLESGSLNKVLEKIIQEVEMEEEIEGGYDYMQT